MAACDNLYGNSHQWKELRDFLAEHKPKWIRLYMKKQPEDDGSNDHRICYIADIQGWLIENCPFPWVKERLNDCFLVQRMICGKAHHENEEELTSTPL